MFKIELPHDQTYLLDYIQRIKEHAIKHHGYSRQNPILEQVYFFAKRDIIIQTSRAQYSIGRLINLLDKTPLSEDRYTVRVIHPDYHVTHFWKVK